MGSISPSLKRTTSANRERKENAPPRPLSLSPLGGEDVRRSSCRWSGSTKPREPLGMPGPGHWLEPHPRGRLEHPWSLRPGTLRAQKPASLHFLCILWVSAGRGTLLSELDRLELALPLLLPQEHLPRQARRSHQPHRHRSVHCSEYTRFYTFNSSYEKRD